MVHSRMGWFEGVQPHNPVFLLDQGYGDPGHIISRYDEALPLDPSDTLKAYFPSDRRKEDSDELSQKELDQLWEKAD